MIPAPTALSTLREEAAGCRRCDLWANATQTVFGEGPTDSDIVFVGEQPGDREDLAGRPFVGPAGAVFDRALAAAGVNRDSVYVTNAVKHFKNELRGKRRLRKKPNAREIERCRWWRHSSCGPSAIGRIGFENRGEVNGRRNSNRPKPEPEP